MLFKRFSMLAVICVVTILSCSHQKTQLEIPPIDKQALVAAKKMKERIDAMSSDTNRLIAYAKKPNSNEPVEVKNGNYPEEIETTFNLLDDKNGRVIYTVEIPFSESGDWFIAYKRYFDESGNLFAYSAETNFFGSSCSPEVEGGIHKRLTRYYDRYHRMIDSAYSLTNNKGKPVKASQCSFENDEPDSIYYSLSGFLKAKHLQKFAR